MLTQARLKELLDYDPETGIFINKTKRCNQRPIGSVAGNTRPDGYRLLVIDGTRYYAHRIAWLYMTGAWPKDLIDHRDANPSNNRWSNLREADSGKNLQNARMRSNNKSGFKGVSFHGKQKLWRATICLNGKYRHLGYSDTPEGAAKLIPIMRVALHGEFARH